MKAYTARQRREIQRLGRRLRVAREASELSQGAAAKACGINQPQLSHIERGLFAPSIPVFRRMAETYRVSADILLGIRE